MDGASACRVTEIAVYAHRTRAELQLRPEAILEATVRQSEAIARDAEDAGTILTTR